MKKTEFMDAIRSISQNLSDKEIADLMEVASSTVQRWRNGTSCPLPTAREYVVRACKKLIEEQRKKR